MRDSLIAAAGARRDDEAPPPPPPPAGVRAFPTAEGFGAEALGGRGSGLNDASRMTVYKVTNLTDPATRAPTFDGSFRWACEATGPRVIVFGVAGYITLQKPLVITNPFLTIAGQTAPGGGVCLKSKQATGMQVTFNVVSSHTVVRHLKSRLYIDPALGTPGAAHASIGMNTAVNTVVQHVIFDHCSATWGYDVVMQILEGSWHHITIQWCLVGEGYQAGHQRALATYAGSGDAANPSPAWEVMGYLTYANNLIVRGDFRCPQIAHKWGRAETINNAVYYFTNYAMNINVLAHGIPPTPGKARYIGNHMERVANPQAPADGNTGGTGPRNTITGIEDAGHDERYLVHSDDNYGPGRIVDTQPDSDSLSTAQRHHYTADPLCSGPAGEEDGDGLVGFPDGKFHWPTHPVTIKSHQQAWRDVVGDTTSKWVPAGAVTSGVVSAGARKPVVDACDQRIINYVLTDGLGPTVTGSKLLTTLPPEGYPTLATTPANAADSGVEAWAPAGDGIPVAWKAANIPAGQFPWQKHSSGYTYMERYINELAGDTNP